MMEISMPFMSRAMHGYSLLLIVALAVYPGFPQERPSPQSSDLDIAEILRKAASYCEKLANSTLDFVCLEQITEKTNFSRDIVSRGSGFVRSQEWKVRDGIFKNTYLYDFQYIRKGGVAKETRLLLKKNGRAVDYRENNLRTSNFQFRDVLLGPVGVLSERSWPDYEYRILGEDQLDGVPVVILDIVPKPETIGDDLYGKVWLDKGHLDILKVEWGQKRVGNFQVFQERANTEHHDLCASVSPDGKYLFFLGQREGKYRIYWVDARIIKNLGSNEMN